MAKTRRIIRKVTPADDRSFDEQFWPVILALFVLGGFLAGTSLAYLELDDRRWYANAWTWLFVIPIVICFSIWLLRKINNRAVHRGVQLSAVLCVIVHILFLIASLETNIFSRFLEKDSEVTEVEDRQLVVEPQYLQFQLEPEQRRQQDFNRPVETETPDPEPEVVRREEPKTEPQAEPKPTPAPENQPTINPSLLERPDPVRTTPRQSEQTSQMSRQTANLQPQLNRSADVPQPRRPRRSDNALESRDAVVRRQTSEPSARPEQERSPTNASPSPTRQQTRSSIARRNAPSQPQTPTDSSAMQERTARPASSVPTSPIDTASPAKVARQSTPDAIRPNSLAQRSQKESPPTADRRQTTMNSTPIDVRRRTRARQLAGASSPEVAQAPETVANQRARSTVRPNVATMAATVGTNPSQIPSTAIEARSSGISRAASSSQAERTSREAPSVSRDNTASLARRSNRDSASPAVAEATATASARSRSRVSTPTNSMADESSAAARQLATAELSPSSSATRRSVDDMPQMARTSGIPSSASVRSDTPSTTSAIRRATASPSPSLSATADATFRRPQRSPNRPEPSTSTVTAPTNATASTGAQSDVIAAATALTRQRTSDSSGQRGQRPGSIADAPSSNRLAAAGTRRSRSTGTPSVAADPSLATGAQPRARSQPLASNSATTTVPSPSLAQSTDSGAGDPSAQPARMAFTRSLSGVAGVGQSPNMDRAMAASQSPSMISSGSARRADSTQNTPNATALTQSTAPMVRQALAGSDRPSATLRATTPAVASNRGAQQPSELNATSAASLVRSSANATQSDTTAMRGNIEIDTGPTRVVDAGGVSRAAGGGQPQPNLSTESDQLVRTRPGGASAPQLALDTTAESTTEGAGTTGGEPTAGELTPSVTLATQGRQGREPVAPDRDRVADAARSAASAAASIASNTIARAGGSSRDSNDAAQPAGGSIERPETGRLARSVLGGSPQLANAAETIGRTAASAEPTAGPDGAASGAASAIAEAAIPTLDRSLASGPRSTNTPTSVAAGGGGEIVGATVIRRAEAAEATLGDPTAGGGSSSPERSGPPPAMIGNLAADLIPNSGSSESSGDPDGTPLASRSQEVVGPSGTLGRDTNAPIGSVAGDLVPEGTGENRIASAVMGRRSDASFAGPSVGEATDAEVARARTGRLSGPPTMLLASEIPSGPASEPATTAGEGAGNENLLALASDMEPMARQSAGGLAVELNADEGPGGFGAEPTPDVGTNSRRASRDSIQIQIETERFIRADVGGRPNLDASAVVAADSFRKRNARLAGEDDGGERTGRAGPETEEAIERGLAFLARYQLADGSWSLQSLNEEVALATDTAATGLALLAFQGAGYNHREFKYASNVSAGIRFLVDNQRANGDLFIPLDDRSNASVWLYSHGIAALALCEAYGMTQDPDLRVPAQKAIDFIVDSQHKQRGGWRYSPNDPYKESDTSVSGWMMMALHSARLANLEVPTETFALVDSYLNLAQGSNGEEYLYRYNPYAPDTEDKRHGRDPSLAMTSVGMLMRMYRGWRKDNENVIRGADYLRENLPTLGTRRSRQRDTYYWYYGTQIMFHMGGEYWQQWNQRLRPLLINGQVRRGPMAGSWDPRRPIPDIWAPQGGRIYVTTMNLLSLEVRYRILPLYEDTAN